MPAQIVPLGVSPNSTLRVALSINGGTLSLNLSLSFNEVAQQWIMAIADSLNNPIVSTVPLLPGYYPAGNILAPYEALQIGEAFMINQDGGLTQAPNSSNLGTSWLLLWTDNTAQPIVA
jgi:hypothetical protein